MRVSFRLAALLALVSTTSFAWAAPPAPKVRLSVVRETGAESCPSASALTGSVAARLGRNPFTESAEQEVEVSFGTDAASALFRAEIRVRGAEGTLTGNRTLTAPLGSSCDTLGSATALAIALHIDPDAALAKHESMVAPAPVPSVTASPAPPAPLPRPVEKMEIAAPSKQTILEAGIGVLSEGVPGIAPVVTMGAGVEVLPSFWLRLSGMVAPEQRSTDGRFAFGLTAGFFGACYDVFRTSREGSRERGPLLSLAPCASIGFGELHAVVFNLLPTEPGTRVWVSGEFSALLRFSPFPPLDFELGLGALAPFVRPRFYVIGETSTVFQQPVVVPAGKLNVGVHFF